MTAMEIRINKSFLKELAKLPQNQRKKIEDFIFHKLENTNTCMKYLTFKNLKGIRIITDYVSEITKPIYNLTMMYYA
jgi:mRNA-degrading endonuclease RelE of RelBE toxin-antitoxin system